MSEKELVLSSAEISYRIKEIGKIITRDYTGCDLLVVGILKGAFVFMADLIREIDLPLQIDFIQAASYGPESFSCGEIKIVKDVGFEIAAKDILIVEDIIDTGHTLSRIIEHLDQQNPNSIRISALIDKKERREINVVVDYVGFEIENGFLVGFGLDYSEQYRNRADIFRLKNV